MPQPSRLKGAAKYLGTPGGPTRPLYLEGFNMVRSNLTRRWLAFQRILSLRANWYQSTESSSFLRRGNERSRHLEECRKIWYCRRKEPLWYFGFLSGIFVIASDMVISCLSRFTRRPKLRARNRFRADIAIRDRTYRGNISSNKF